MLHVLLNAAVFVLSTRRLDSEDDDDESQTLSEIEPWRLALTTILAVTFGACAAGAGIGGGGLLVPTYAFVLGVGARNAVPLSGSTILGVALGNYLQIGFLKHPNPLVDRPLIDYNLAAFMNSALLLGTVFGVLFNTLLPELIIIILLMLVLFYNAFRTIRKGFRLRDKESKEMEVQEKSAKQEQRFEVEEAKATGSTDSLDGTDLAPEQLPLTEQKEEGELEDIDLEKNEAPAPTSDALAKLNASAAVQFPPVPFSLLALSLLFIVIYSLVKGGVIGGISACSAGWWVWYCTPIIFYGAMCYGIAVWYLKPLHERRVEAGFLYVEGDLKWDNDTIRRFPIISWIAGVAAALLGIGGGMILGPVMLDIGIVPQVATATNGFSIIFTAISSVVQFIAAGRLSPELSGWAIGSGFIAGQIGSRGLRAVLARTGRQSFVILLLGYLIAVSAFAMVVSGVIQVVQGVNDGDGLFNVDVNDVC
eukprot:scaffold1726_cov260-Pinguiococcus_pyrenoidosus.AAC.6